MKEVNAPKCERENDLIAFLYGELNDTEARTFQSHMRDCASCNAELTAFRDIRDSVVAWRNESLGGVISYPIAESVVSSADHEKPSALAALRAFFNLSPLWMKGALAFASVLFCLFALLAIARLRDKPPAAVANNPGKQVYSEEQLNALVEQRVQAELQRARDSQAKAPPAPVIVNASGSNRGRQVTRSGNELAANANQRRPLSKTERQQLAADLRLSSGKNDSDLDLLDDRINQ